MGKRALPTLCYLHVTQSKIGRQVSVINRLRLILGLSKWVRNLSACTLSSSTILIAFSSAFSLGIGAVMCDLG